MSSDSSLSKQKEDKKDPAELVNHDWKTILVGSLNKPKSSIDCERGWAHFSESLRDLRPESNWLFIRDENYVQNEAEILEEIKSLIISMTESNQWPFPETIIITSDGRESFRSWKILISKTEGNLPAVNERPGISFNRYSDESCHGYKFRSIPKLNSKRIG